MKTREEKLESVLEVVMSSLYTYGKHPIIEAQVNEALKPVKKNDLSHVVMGCYTQDNVIEILENATDLQDAIAIIKEGNDGDNNP